MAMVTSKKIISVIIPSFNEGKNIDYMYNKLTDVLKYLTDYDYEIIYINDGSEDDTWEKISSLSKKDKKVLGICFSKNFGHQAAIESGLKKARGDAVIMMDGDGQHPPDVIPELIKKWEEGFEIVNTQRIETEGVSFIKKATSKLFYNLINVLSSTKIEEGSADFRLLDRIAVNEINKLTEKDKFYRGLVNWIGFKRTTVEYKARKRVNGESSYSFKKMIEFARIGITSFSMLPMKIIMLIGGLLFVTGGLLTIIMVIFRYVLHSSFFSGTAILVSFIILNNGLLIILLGIISVYQINMYKQLQNRPNYIIRGEI